MTAGMIYAVEGPSGAGKDYYIENIYFSGFKSPRVINWPRELGPDLGACLSSVSDYQAIAYAMMVCDNVMVNRFIISRWVYMAFEQGIIDSSTHYKWYITAAAADIWKTFNLHVETAKRDYYLRVGRVLTGFPLVHFTMILPSVVIAEARRAQTGKTYPYDYLTEKYIYEDLVTELRHYQQFQFTIKDN